MSQVVELEKQGEQPMFWKLGAQSGRRKDWICRWLIDQSINRSYYMGCTHKRTRRSPLSGNERRWYPELYAETSIVVRSIKELVVSVDRRSGVTLITDWEAYRTINSEWYFQLPCQWYLEKCTNWISNAHLQNLDKTQQSSCITNFQIGKSNSQTINRYPTQFFTVKICHPS